MPITNPNPTAADKMTLEQIRRAVETNEREEREERNEQIASRRSLESSRRDLFERVGAARRELARDLKCEPDGLLSAITLRATHVGDVAPIWAALTQLLNLADGNAGVDIEAAREARHVLATIGGLPPVRKDDASLGSAKPLRDLPKATVRAPMVSDGWYEDLVKLAGLTYPARVEPELETYEEARDRIGRHRDRFHYDRTSEARNSQLATRELELLDLERTKANHLATQNQKAALVAQRTEMLAGVERALANLELDVSWWWSRELRRHVAGERRRIEDTKHVWHATQTLGVRFDFKGKA